MDSKNLMQDLQLKREYRQLAKKAKSTAPGEETTRIAAEMARIRAQRRALRPARPMGRPRIHPVGHKRSDAKGSPEIRAEAAALRKERAEITQRLVEIQKRFDRLAARGGPSR